MKLSTALLIIATMGTAGWYGYTRWYSRPPTGSATSKHLVFPVERLLTDRHGRTVPARLLARSTNQVRFLRTSDGSTYDYPISSLTDEDQQFILRFPESTLHPLATAGKKSPAESLVVSQLRAERTGLEHKIQLMDLELQKEHNKSPILPRDEIFRRKQEARNRIIEIDKQLLEIAFRSSTGH